MPKKKRASSPSPKPSRGTGEKILSDLSRILAGKSFDSEDDLNAFLAELSNGGALPAPQENDAADEVWDLLEQAQESRSPKRRVTLARRVLELDPDNADACLFLAEEANTRAEAMTWLIEAVQAGERALPDDIETLAAEGSVWLDVDSRPYMRARTALAMEFWTLGDRQPAIDLLWELLRLNPNDNQGLRYVLLSWLLSAGSVSSIDQLLALYPDDGAAAWQYDRALHAFRTTGDSAASRKLLASAVRQNPHVPATLLGVMPLPDVLPDYIGFGDETEAAAYVANAFLRWSESREAIEWLIARTGKRTKAGAARRPRMEM
jgi:tetratricopeptide (TPR) repeat protein